MLKRYFIKKAVNLGKANKVINAYPIIINSIIILSNNESTPSKDFVNTIKSCFNEKAKITLIRLSKNESKDDGISFSYKSLSLLGRVKDDNLNLLFKNVHMLIDMTTTETLIKNYIISQTKQAYKIKIGAKLHDKFNLTITTKASDDVTFANEIIKYHNILSHAKK